MGQRSLPGEWEARLIEGGYTYRGKPSASRLAAAAGVSPTAVLRVIFREGESDTDTLARISDAMRDGEFIAGWVGAELEPHHYRPPAEARFLNSEEQEVINRLIRVMARGKTGGNGHGESRQKRLGGVDGGTGRRDGDPGSTPTRTGTLVPENTETPERSDESEGEPAGETYDLPTRTTGTQQRGRSRNRRGSDDNTTSRGWGTA